MPRRKQAPDSRISPTTDGDPEALIAAATTRRRQPAKGRAAGNAKAKAQAASALPEKVKTNRSRKKVARFTSDSELDEHPPVGEGTRSGSDPWAGVHDEEATSGRWSIGGMLLCVVAVSCLALSIIAWRSAPGPSQHCVLLQPEGVPRALFAQWVRGFPNSESLFARPDLATLESFAAYLGSQSAVESVRSVRLLPGEGEHQGTMTLNTDLVLRRPLLPVILATGERAWLSDSGHLLPGILPGPSGQPLVRGLEYSEPAVVQELVAVWPELSLGIDAFMPGLISEIRCDAPLSGSDSLGLVFVTRPGTLLTWGNPKESRYGVSRDKRLRNLLHTLRCQGDLRRVPEINVRFYEPFAVLR